MADLIKVDTESAARELSSLRDRNASVRSNLHPSDEVTTITANRNAHEAISQTQNLIENYKEVFSEDIAKILKMNENFRIFDDEMGILNMTD